MSNDDKNWCTHAGDCSTNGPIAKVKTLTAEVERYREGCRLADEVQYQTRGLLGAGPNEALDDVAERVVAERDAACGEAHARQEKIELLQDRLAAETARADKILEEVSVGDQEPWRCAWKGALTAWKEMRIKRDAERVRADGFQATARAADDETQDARAAYVAEKTRADEAVRLLALVEWSGYSTEDGERVCPVCGAWVFHKKHGYACALGALLGTEIDYAKI